MTALKKFVFEHSPGTLHARLCSRKRDAEFTGEFFLRQSSELRQLKGFPVVIGENLKHRADAFGYLTEILVFQVGRILGNLYLIERKIFISPEMIVDCITRDLIYPAFKLSLVAEGFNFIVDFQKYILHYIFRGLFVTDAPEYKFFDFLAELEVYFFKIHKRFHFLKNICIIEQLCNTFGSHENTKTRKLVILCFRGRYMVVFYEQFLTSYNFMGENTMCNAMAVFAAFIVFLAVPLNSQSFPPSNETAREALDQSPRHGEFVDIAFPDAEYSINAWVVYPERPTRAPVIIVIHEIFGLTDWIRAIADDLAREGYLAIAPDFISGLGPDGGGTESFESRDDVVRTIRSFTPDEVANRLNAVHNYALTIPAATENIATIGFCWGGLMSFYYATVQPELNAAVVFYGTSPDTELLHSIKAPVLGLYAEDDARVNITIEPAAKEMERLGKTFEWYMYPGAGHGFVRQQDGRDGANLSATERAWERMYMFLHEHME